MSAFPPKAIMAKGQVGGDAQGVWVDTSQLYPGHLYIVARQSHLSRDQVVQLRDHLGEWLVHDPDAEPNETIPPLPTGTDSQVNSLIAITQSIVQDIEAGRCDYATSGTVYRYLREALAPFEDDPDAELVERVTHLRQTAGGSVETVSRDIIAAVREYDAKGGAK